MGEARTCLVLLFVLVQLQVICSQSYFESFICDFLCDDDDSSDFCDDCSSEESSKSSTTKPSSGAAMTPSQNISIKIPASQGTILDILNFNGLWSVNVDAQGNSGASSPAAAASSTPQSTTAAESTTAATSTTAAK